MVLNLYCTYQCLCASAHCETRLQIRNSDGVVQAGFPTLQLSLQYLDLLFLEESNLETVPTRQLTIGVRVFCPLFQLCVKSSACVLTAADSFLRSAGCSRAQLIPLWRLYQLKEPKAVGMRVDIYNQIFDQLRCVLDSLDIVAEDPGDMQRRHDEADDGGCCGKNRFGHLKAAKFVRCIECSFEEMGVSQLGTGVGGLFATLEAEWGSVSHKDLLASH